MREISILLFRRKKDEKVEIIGMGKYAWRGLLNGISAEAASKVLSSGRELSENLEENLAEMVSSEKIDLKMYNAVRSDTARKTLAAKMPESVKMAMKAGLANAFSARLKASAIYVLLSTVSIPINLSNMNIILILTL